MATTTTEAKTATKAKRRYFAISMSNKALTEVSSVAKADDDAVVISAPSDMQFPAVKKLVGNATIKIYKAYRG